MLLSWLENHSMYRKVACLIPGQGTAWIAGLTLSCSVCQLRQIHLSPPRECFSLCLSLSVSLSLSLSHQGKHVLDFSIYFLHQGSEFSVTVFSKRFSISGPSLLLPAAPWCEGWWAWSRPRGSLICSHFLRFFFHLLFCLSVFSSLYLQSLIWFSAFPSLL